MDLTQQQAFSNSAVINAKAPAVMHSEPSALRDEAVQRLKHYSVQEEKLELELARIRQMIHACQMMLNSFDQEKKADTAENY